MGKNNLWTQLDGTVIDRSFTSTFDGSTGQPNGGSSQNCIVINAEPSSTHAPNKTQDKACSSSYKTKSMLCYIDTKGGIGISLFDAQSNHTFRLYTM